MVMAAKLIPASPPSNPDRRYGWQRAVLEVALLI